MRHADSIVWLNVGCGPNTAPSWLNCDVAARAGVDIQADIRRGLPIAASCIDCIAAIHLLQDLAWPEIGRALAELRRVLKPCGVLRLALPDLDKAIRAYVAGDASYFHVPDSDARSIGAKLVTQIIWYGSVRTPITFDFIDEWLRNAGFVDVAQQSFGASRVPGLASLDNRERESLFVEASKPPAR